MNSASKTETKLKASLAEANTRLKLGKCGVAIAQRGDRLSLVATLPPKPNSQRTDWYQQRIPLGIYANFDGIRFAEAKAKEVGALLAQDKFDWSKVADTVGTEELPNKQPPCSQLVETFKAEFFVREKRSPITWKKDYEAVYNHLPQDRPLTEAVILEMVRGTEPNTRHRKRYCIALNALAKFAGVQVDLKPYSGNYSSTKVQPRDIPSDEEILHYYHKIVNPEWRYAYALLAAYGIRPNELGFLCFDELPTLKVIKAANTTKGKRADRQIYPLPPEWVKEFGLDIPQTLPNVQSFGDRACHRFQAYKIPFQPYDLRHAWCVRGTVRLGLPIPVMAKMAGHSPKVHLDTYQQWLENEEIIKAYQKIQPAMKIIDS